MNAKEFNKRKQVVVSSLISIGESRIAQDFAEATQKESFEYCEHIMRQMLKRAIDEPFRAQVLASAIVEAQLLPNGGGF